MEARLPEEKLTYLKEEVSQWISRTDARKWEILSLVSSLQHTSKVVRYGRVFVSRIYATAAKLRKLHSYIRLNLEFRSDLCWWNTFLTDWNGLSLLWWDDTEWIPSHSIQTDVSGNWGCTSFWSDQWFQWVWLPEWANFNNMVKELAQIVLSCTVWGRQLSGRRILFECDNSSVVSAVNKHCTREQNAMHFCCPFQHWC